MIISSLPELSTIHFRNCQQFTSGIGFVIYEIKKAQEHNCEDKV